MLSKQVFGDLKSRGLIIGPGDAFGGDFTVYKGDPNSSHSFAVVRSIEDGKVCADKRTALTAIIELFLVGIGPRSSRIH